MPGQIRICCIKRLMTVSIALLVLFHLLGQFSAHFLGRGHLLGFVGMFRLQSEHNVPTYFSGLLLGFASLLLLLIAWHVARQSARQALPWVGLGVMFIYLACDELLSIHERFHFLGDAMPMADALNYKWVVAGALLVLAVVWLFFRFWWRLPSSTRLLFAVAAVVYVTGAIGVETLCGLYAKHYAEDFRYAALTAIEEGMEMAGVACFILALARYIQPRFAPFGVGLVPEPVAAHTDSVRPQPDPAERYAPAIHGERGRPHHVS